MIRVRLAEPEDIQKVSDLWLKMVNEIYPDNTPRPDWWIEICKALMATARYCIVVAENNDGKIIGFIDGFTFPEPSTGMIHGVGQHMYIEPDYRNTMVAMKIYRKIMKVAKLLKVQMWEFYCTPDNSTFWKKKGFNIQRIMMRRSL